MVQIAVEAFLLSFCHSFACYLANTGAQLCLEGITCEGVFVVMMRRLLLVFAGGFCGTLARYLLSAPLLALAPIWFPGVQAGIPYDIFLINCSGALALGLLSGLAEGSAAISPELRLTFGTGFLGAYTTLSTFAYGGEQLLSSGATLPGTLYLGGTLALGIACAWLGYALAPQALRLASGMPAWQARRLYLERLTRAERRRLRDAMARFAAQAERDEQAMRDDDNDSGVVLSDEER
jgi:CrcB protein